MIYGAEVAAGYGRKGSNMKKSLMVRGAFIMSAALVISGLSPFSQGSLAASRNKSEASVENASGGQEENSPEDGEDDASEAALKKVLAAERALKSAEASRTAAETEYNEAKNFAEDKRQAVNEAESEAAESRAAAEEGKKKADEANEALAAAEKSRDELEEKLDLEKSSLESLESQIEEKEKEISDAESQDSDTSDIDAEIESDREQYEALENKWNRGSVAFFEDMGSSDAADILKKDSKKACEYAAQIRTVDNGYSVEEALKSSTALDNMKDAIELIRENNELRVADEHFPGNSALMVSDLLMACAQADCDFAADKVEHPQQLNVGMLWGENLAWGYSDPFMGWYTEEKKNYENQKNNSNGETGHYLNITDPDYKALGMGKGNISGEAGYSPEHCQFFSDSTEGAYSVDDYAERFNSYYDSLKSELEKAKSAYEAAETEKSGRESKVTTLRDELEKLRAEKESREEAVKETKASLSESLEKIKAASSQAAELNTGYDELLKDQQEKETLLDTARAELKTAEEEEESALEAFEQADAAYREAEENYEQAAAEYKEITEKETPEPEKPEETKEPAETETPEVTEEPERTKEPEKTAEPEETYEPVETDVPGEIEVPGETQKPEETSTPVHTAIPVTSLPAVTIPARTYSPYPEYTPLPTYFPYPEYTPSPTYSPYPQYSPSTIYSPYNPEKQNTTSKSSDYRGAYTGVNSTSAAKATASPAPKRTSSVSKNNTENTEDDDDEYSFENSGRKVRITVKSRGSWKLIVKADRKIKKIKLNGRNIKAGKKKIVINLSKYSRFLKNGRNLLKVYAGSKVKKYSFRFRK